MPQKLPATGAFVLAPNHYSDIDPVIMGWSMWKLGRAPRFLAKASLFAVPVVGAVLRGTGQIPVERRLRRAAASRSTAAHELVDDGHAVIIYPEGTLTRDPDLWPMRGKTGAVRMALEHGSPLIPVAHWGTQEVMPRYSKKISLFPRKTHQGRVRRPVDLDELPRQADRLDALLTEATDARHGRHHRAARGAARRDRPRGALEPRRAQPEGDRPL